MANPEVPGLYDARALALGGAVGPITDGPSAIYHNPAGLAHVDRFELNIAFHPTVARLDAPFAGAGTEQSTGWVMAPLGFAGGAFRVHERVTLGFGMYISTLFGGMYDDVARIGDCSLPAAEQMTCGAISPPADQMVAFLVAEAAVPIAINVLPNLRLGVSLRLPYGVQLVDSSAQLGGTYFRAQQDVSGFGVPGVLFGVQWDPHDQVSLSFAYRSKVRVHMEGTVDLSALFPNATSVPSQTDWYVPHMLRAGIAWRPLHDRLRIVAEGRVQLHEDANRAQIFEIDFLGGMTQVIPFNWRNSFILTAGAEYEVTDRWPVRLGFTWANSATPRSTVTPFQVPPDVSPGFTVGSGFHAPMWSVDVALGYSGGAETHIPNPLANCRDPSATTPSGCDGTYAVKTLLAGLSFEYTLGGRDYELGGDADVDVEIETDPDPDLEAAPLPADPDGNAEAVAEPEPAPENDPAPDAAVAPAP